MDCVTEERRSIAFIGTYLPRPCGIATFTYDLAQAVAANLAHNGQVAVVAMDDQAGGYEYADEVRWQVRQEVHTDYVHAAESLNAADIDIVNLQHEYGIFGGEFGANILTLVRQLRKPLVMTCHTVLAHPAPLQRNVFREIAARASKVVVMSQRAAAFVASVYGVPQKKTTLIPHGIHDLPVSAPSNCKAILGLSGRRVLLTFGLLSRAKGVEHVIEALPRVVKRHPNTLFIVLGATHPAVLREEGEAYRQSLESKVANLGLQNHVLFEPRFVELRELFRYIGASDICLTPYMNTDHISSGVLSYAMAMGKPVVSSPYWYAEELLADGRGRLVPPGDSAALADEILDLLGDHANAEAIGKRAYAYCRRMTWPTVAASYVRLFEEVCEGVPRPLRPLQTDTATHALAPVSLTTTTSSIPSTGADGQGLDFNAPTSGDIEPRTTASKPARSERARSS
jgi:glycosyltransferase involved in cell wall biosynthesis